VVIDLQDDPAPFGEYAKPLILSVLEKNGLFIEEMQGWKVALNKSSISLQGTLSAEGLQRVMSVVELPADPMSVIEPQAAAAPKAVTEAPESLTREASLKYFKTIEQQIDSLRMQKKDAKSLGQVAAWINNAARRIDRMSTLNVDPELADYAADMSADLRNMVGALQGAGIQTGARRSAIWNSNGGYDSYYYGYDNTDAQSARRQVKAEEEAKGATTALDLSREIANKTTAVRRKMTDRYKVAF
jgi:hypothetical protein